MWLPARATFRLVEVVRKLKNNSLLARKLPWRFLHSSIHLCPTGCLYVRKDAVYTGKPILRASFFLDNNLIILFLLELEPEEPVSHLKPEVLLALGKAGEEPLALGPDIHPSIAEIWKTILQKGLEKKGEILDKCPTPANLQILATPKLNPEIRVVLSEACVQRDARLAEVQTSIGGSLALVGSELTSFLAETGEPNVLPRIETLGKVGRLLCDVFHTQSTSRRALIGVSLNMDKNLKEAISGAPVDTWLFGEGLGDRITRFRALQKSSEDLKPKQKLPRLQRPANAPLKQSRNQLNYRSLPRQPPHNSRQGRQSQQSRNRTHSKISTSYTHRNKEGNSRFPRRH